MARTTEVDYRDVAKACLDLFIAGENVSFAKVYAALGNKGSGKVVNEMIKRWRSETGDMLAVRAERSLPGVPDAVVATLDSTALTLWQAALAQAEEAYAAARDRLEIERGDWMFRLDAAKEVEAQLQVAQVTLDERTRAHAELQVLTQEREASLREREAQVTALREELARLTALLEAEQRSHADALTQAASRADERLAEAQQRHQAELDLAAERADGERQHYAGITDQLRQSALAEKTYLTEQLTATKAMLEGYRLKAGRADTELARMHGRAEAAEARAEAAETILARLTTKREKRKPAEAAA